MSEGAALERSGEKDCKGDLAILLGESLFSGFGPPFCFVRMGSSNTVWEERVCALSHVRLFVGLFVTPWIVARQAPLSTGFPRQEYWSGLPIHSPGDLPDPGIDPGPLALQTVHRLSHLGSLGDSAELLLVQCLGPGSETCLPPRGRVTSSHWHVLCQPGRASGAQKAGGWAGPTVLPSFSVC